MLSSQFFSKHKVSTTPSEHTRLLHAPAVLSTSSPWLPAHKLSGLNLVSRISPSHFPWKSPGTGLVMSENFHLFERCLDVITETTIAEMRLSQILFYIFIRTSYHKIWYPYPCFSFFFCSRKSLVPVLNSLSDRWIERESAKGARCGKRETPCAREVPLPP